MSNDHHRFATGDFFTLSTDPRRAGGVAFQVCSLYFDEALEEYLIDAVTPATAGQIIVQGLMPELLLPVLSPRSHHLRRHFPAVQDYYSAPLPAEEERFVLRVGDLVTLRGAGTALMEREDRTSFEHYMAIWVDLEECLCNLISPIGPCQRVLRCVPVADTRFVPPYRALRQRARFPELVEESYINEEHYLPEAYVRQFLGAGLCSTHAI